MADEGVARVWLNYHITSEMSHSHVHICHSYWQFSSVVTRSQAVFGRSLSVTLVEGPSTMHIEGLVTISWSKLSSEGFFICDVKETCKVESC